VKELLTCSKIITEEEYQNLIAEDLEGFVKSCLRREIAEFILQECEGSIRRIERPALFEDSGAEFRLTLAVLTPERYRDLLRKEKALDALPEMWTDAVNESRKGAEL
jgi:hypothetical protein